MDIMDFCEIVPDCRNDKNKIYSATELVFITTVSVLCGSDTWNEIHYFCERNFDYFKRRLPDLQGVPSHDTLNAFFSVLDIREFEGIFRVWINEICSRIPGVVAIDGKAVCKDPDGKNGVKSKLYMVSAWAASNGICLGQVKVNEKSNEITAIPELLSELALDGCIVTIDSMGCQKTIAEMIISAGADYVLAVKDNQEKLKKDIEFWLSEDERLNFRYGRRYTTEETGHGRHELRECVVADFAKEARLFFKEWKGLRTLAKVTATRTVAGHEPTTETRYYIASVEADPKLVMETVRTHWQVENNLHWMLDVAFREDYTRKTDNAAINLSLINKVALTMLKQTKRKEGIASRRKFCGWDENFRDEVLGIKFID